MIALALSAHCFINIINASHPSVEWKGIKHFHDVILKIADSLKKLHMFAENVENSKNVWENSFLVVLHPDWKGALTIPCEERDGRPLSFSEEISLGEWESEMRLFILKAFSSFHVKIQESTRKYYTFYTNAIFPDFSRNKIIIFTIYTNCKWIKFLVFVFTLNIRDAFPTESYKI